MQIIHQIVHQGNWLFRWRSYLPFLLLPLLVYSLWEYQRPLGSDGLHLAWGIFSLIISILGLGIRCLTVGRVPAGTSGRNTRCQVAEQLNTLGIYSIIRHPLYLGNYLIGLGVFIAPFSGSVSLIYSLAFCLYYERIMAAEEAFLRNKFQDEFEFWASETPAFWPRPSLWKPAALPFSLRNVLRREYTGLLVVVSFHTAVELFKNYVATGILTIKPIWIAGFTITVLVYFALRTMKKHTRVLQVQYR